MASAADVPVGSAPAGAGANVSYWNMLDYLQSYDVDLNMAGMCRLRSKRGNNAACKIQRWWRALKSTTPVGAGAGAAASSSAGTAPVGAGADANNDDSSPGWHNVLRVEEHEGDTIFCLILPRRTTAPLMDAPFVMAASPSGRGRVGDTGRG